MFKKTLQTFFLLGLLAASQAQARTYAKKGMNDIIREYESYKSQIIVNHQADIIISCMGVTYLDWKDKYVDIMENYPDLGQSSIEGYSDLILIGQNIKKLHKATIESNRQGAFAAVMQTRKEWRDEGQFPQGPEKLTLEDSNKELLSENFQTCFDPKFVTTVDSKAPSIHEMGDHVTVAYYEPSLIRPGDNIENSQSGTFVEKTQAYEDWILDFILD